MSEALALLSLNSINLQLTRTHLGVLRVNLLGIDFGVTGNQAVPPFHLIDLRGGGGRYPWRRKALT